MSHYDFYQNKECENFPSHKGADPETFSCLFCFCPLYALGEQCGGSCTYTEQAIKDCSNCLRPHRRENYPAICRDLTKVMELARKKPEEKA